MSSSVSHRKSRQQRMGPAPFASFEDLSDELESPTDERHHQQHNTLNLSGSVVRLPGIREDATPSITPSTTPQMMDRSGASPDFTLGGGISLIGTAGPSSKSTTLKTPRIEFSRASSGSYHEDSMDQKEADEVPDLRSSTEDIDGVKSPNYLEELVQQRKDSQSSDVGLLPISGRTSRLSSVGSGGSGHSQASRLSAPNLSPAPSTRSSSPHKMQLETSFCGPKAVNGNSIAGTKLTDEEALILSRVTDPTVAVIAEGVQLNPPPPAKSKSPSGERAKTPPPNVPIVIEPEAKCKLPKRMIGQSGVEYIYIPLKGPLPIDDSSQKNKYTPSTISRTALKEEPTTIRIKLKPDEGDEDVEPPVPSPVRLSPNKVPSAANSKSPSPSLSRKSSFASLFRGSKPESVSPESPMAPPSRRRSTLSGILRDATDSIRDKTRSRSKSRERSTTPTTAESTTPNKSTFSLFTKQPKAKSPTTTTPIKSPVPKPLPHNNIEPIHVPLHSPTYYERPLPFDNISQNNNKTDDVVLTSPEEAVMVTDAIHQQVEAIIEPPPPELKQQDSVSSENVVFSMNLSDSVVFTTKLPKEKPLDVDSSDTSEASQPPPLPRPSTPPATSPTPKVEEEPEREGLVLQHDDSYEEELPYVPTTLPQERSKCLPIVPVRERSSLEMKMCPIDRPRSTTPINPNCLEEYCEEVVGAFESERLNREIEKLIINLPRTDSIGGGTAEKTPKKSPNWSEFATGSLSRNSIKKKKEPVPPPQLQQRDWINFDEIPEKRKAPKRIQTLPSSGGDLVVTSEKIVYSYVNPDECKCECHEINSRKIEHEHNNNNNNNMDSDKKGAAGNEVDPPEGGEQYSGGSSDNGDVEMAEDEMPLLDDEDGGDEEKGFRPEGRYRLEVATVDNRSDSSIDLSGAEPLLDHRNGHLPEKYSISKESHLDEGNSSNIRRKKFSKK